VEIIFHNNDVFDGIIVDTDLQEGRDVAYVNHTYVAYDSDLGGQEDVSVAISDEGDNDFYMIIEETNIPEEDIENDWVCEEGDTVAVTVQSWVDIAKTPNDRPNYSSGNPGNMGAITIRCSIGPTSTDLYSNWYKTSQGKDIKGHYFLDSASEPVIIPNGKKDEDCWTLASSNKTKLYLVSKTSPSSLLHSADPAYKEVEISIIHNKRHLYIFLEIYHEDNDTNLEEMIMVFGNDNLCLQNLSAPLLLVKINPTNGSYTRSGINAELRIPGVVPNLSPDYYGVVSTVQTYNIQDLEYGTFRDFGPHGVESVEVKLPIFDLAPSSFLPETDPVTDLFFNLAEWAIWDDSDSSNPYDGYYSAMTFEEDQLHFTLHKIELSDETSTPTRTNSFFSTTVFILIPVVWVITLRKRKLKK
jgi:hypothetical protein